MACSTRAVLLLTIGGVLATANAAGHAQIPEQAKPYIGQPGKDVVWVPTPPETVALMLDLARVSTGDIVMDLGSGDGRNIIAAAKRGARAVGVEYTPELVEVSRAAAAKEGVSELASFIQGDMYEADISQATVLALFLLPENLRKLTPKFLDLKPGARIVVNTFAVPGWEPDARERTEGECHSWCEALLYIVPAKVAGTWQLPQGTMTVTQDFQKVSGHLESGGRSISIENGRLRGADIQFTLDKVVYSGRVAGNTIEGEMQDGTKRERFTAKRVG